jgi:Mannosyltransferase (PIG-V)
LRRSAANREKTARRIRSPRTVLPAENLQPLFTRAQGIIHAHMPQVEAATVPEPALRHWGAPRVAAAALALRVMSATLALFVSLTFPLDQPRQTTVFSDPSPFWDTFARYDSGWYFQIAKHGYRFVVGGPSVGVGKPGKIAYFPVYPLLMRYAGRLFGSTNADVYLGGILVSWTAFVVAMVALFYLARLDVDEDQAERTTLLAAIFPFSFFFGMVYSEAVFLLLTVVSFYAFRTRRPILGGLAGGLATATRVNGILMLPALAWIACRSTEPTRRERTLACLGLALVACGIGGYSLYVYQLSGNPFEWMASITRWGYHPGGAAWMAPVQLVQRLFTHPYRYLTTDRMAVYDTLHGVTGVLFVLAVPFVWRRLGAAYGLFMLLNLYLPLSSGVFEGMGRYCSVLFPAFIWLGSIRSRTVFLGALVLSAMLYTLCLALFTTIHPLF